MKPEIKKFRNVDFESVSVDEAKAFIVAAAEFMAAPNLLGVIPRKRRDLAPVFERFQNAVNDKMEADAVEAAAARDSQKAKDLADPVFVAVLDSLAKGCEKVEKTCRDSIAEFAAAAAEDPTYAIEWKAEEVLFHHAVLKEISKLSAWIAGRDFTCDELLERLRAQSDRFIEDVISNRACGRSTCPASNLAQDSQFRCLQRFADAFRYLIREIEKDLSGRCDGTLESAGCVWAVTRVV